MTVKSTEFVLSRRALRISQSSEAPIYLFSLTAKEILQVAEISRVGRGDHSELIGYQRPEVRQHVREITDYLNGDDVLFPVYQPPILLGGSNAPTHDPNGPDGEVLVVVAGCYQVDGSVDRPAQVGGEKKSAHGQVIANGQYDVFQAGQGGLVV